MRSRRWILGVMLVTGVFSVWACSDDDTGFTNTTLDSGAPDGTRDGTSTFDSSVSVPDSASDVAADSPTDAPADSPSDAGLDAYVFDGGVSFVEYTIPSPDGGARHPREITLGPDGNLWFTEYDTSTIGRITPTGDITELPVLGSYLEGIVVGSDGAIWFTDLARPHLGRITTSGTTSYFPIAPDGGDAGIFNAYGLANGPDNNLWFTSFGGTGRIGRMTVGGTTTTFNLPEAGANGLRGIASGPNGLWYGVLDEPNIGNVSTSGNFTLFPTGDAGTANGPFRLTQGPDGNVWFTRFSPGAIGRITPTGVLTEFPVPSANPGLLTIVTGADGNLWFAEAQANKIARCTPSGVITEFTMPTVGSNPFGLAPGPNNTIWITEYATGKIAVLTLH